MLSLSKSEEQFKKKKKQKKKQNGTRRREVLKDHDGVSMYFHHTSCR
jgi:hypothetical protein